MLNLYHRFFSPLLHWLSAICYSPFAGCRFSPTCSVYLGIAIRKYGIIAGGLLGLKRFFHCHPYSTTPHLDPVPDK